MLLESLLLMLLVLQPWLPLLLSLQPLLQQPLLLPLLPLLVLQPVVLLFVQDLGLEEVQEQVLVEVPLVSVLALVE